MVRTTNPPSAHFWLFILKLFTISMQPQINFDWFLIKKFILPINLKIFDLKKIHPILHLRVCNMHL